VVASPRSPILSCNYEQRKNSLFRIQIARRREKLFHLHGICIDKDIITFEISMQNLSRMEILKSFKNLPAAPLDNLEVWGSEPSKIAVALHTKIMQRTLLGFQILQAR
jgi:hypothetical protein